MKKNQKSPQLILMSDGSWVIAGAHLTVEEAEKQFGGEYRRETDSKDEIVLATLAWLRYEIIGEDDMDFDDVAPGTKMWILYETKNKPKGVVRKATVIV